MKIAVATIDQQTVSKHFGQSAFYVVFTVENGKITNKEIKERQAHCGHHKSDTHTHNHNHSHDHGSTHEHNAKHDKMAQEIADCQVLIAGGMGRGAYNRFFTNGINVVMTNIQNINQAIDLYIEGNLPNLFTELTH